MRNGNIGKSSNNAASRPRSPATPRRTSHQSQTSWQSAGGRSDYGEKMTELPLPAESQAGHTMAISKKDRRRARMRDPWAMSWSMFGVVLTATALLLAVVYSFLARQLDTKGARMSYMASGFVKYPDFDTEHTALATKYSIYLYRELGIDEEPKVKGAPVLFIPGNAGSYKQARSLASEAAHHFHQYLRDDGHSAGSGKLPLDFFTVDFNEDITAFHGQTMLDQAEYLNEAIAFILKLYHDPQRSVRDPNLPDPTSVILVGHSMGGVVARTMLTMPNYQMNSVNTIITLSAPHAKAPVSFDSRIVQTYAEINDYWRRSHTKEWGTDNPLWHVTLISIAGGGLDTIVPSDYSSVASLMPETHGFTVYTSSIPDVWTGMDHLAITWCDQLRKVIIKALYDVMDVQRSAQTKVRGERMRSFKKHFLTGLEDVAEKSLAHQELKTILTLEDDANAILPQGQRLVLRELGQHDRKSTYLLPIPPTSQMDSRFTLITDQQLSSQSGHSNIDVLFCSVYPLQMGKTAAVLSMDLNDTGDASGPTRLACKNGAVDNIKLPASDRYSYHPFDDRPPFSYLQFDLKDIEEHQFVAVIDRAAAPTHGWVIAEFGPSHTGTVSFPNNVQQFLEADVQVRFPANRPLVQEIKLPSLASSLLSYHLSIERQGCSAQTELFTPLVRQYVSDVYESKFFVNARNVEINLHGVAPYLPPALQHHRNGEGLSLQIWSDPTCDGPMVATVRLDTFGSLGKLWMRYRTLFATMPLLIVALVLRHQFRVYDTTGVFMSFSESLDQSLRRSIPVALGSLGLMATFLVRESQYFSQQASSKPRTGRNNATETVADFTRNDLLLGSPDYFFWILLPVFGIIAAGLSILLNYTVLTLTFVFTAVYSRLKPSALKGENARRTPACFAVTSTRQRVVTTTILLFLVSTVIPYQFAYVVLCIVAVATSCRALRVTWENNTEANQNFYNYAHSILVLMMWILPINVPVLVVWIRNLAVHWLTPFSSHHNISSIMPFILLIETMSTGRMIPRITTSVRYVTNALFVILAFCAALYGVSFAYLLHHVVDIICAWLVVLHWSTAPLPTRLQGIFGGAGGGGGKDTPATSSSLSSSSSSSASKPLNSSTSTSSLTAGGVSGTTGAIGPGNGVAGADMHSKSGGGRPLSNTLSTPPLPPDAKVEKRP